MSAPLSAEKLSECPRCGTSCYRISATAVMWTMFTLGGLEARPAYGVIEVHLDPHPRHCPRCRQTELAL